METCSAPDCDRDGLVKGMCRKHYMRLLRKGSIDPKRKNARKECSVDGCGNLTAAHGLCDRHYRRQRYEAVRNPGRSCAFCGGPIDDGRKSTARFCSTSCKVRSTQPARARRYQLRVKYGIGDADFDALLVAQNGGCAICRTEKPRGRGQRFHVDHDHATGEVRGILCSECNTGLGKFRDDPELVRRALEYLSR